MRGTVAKRIRNEARRKAANKPTKYNVTWVEKWFVKTDDKGKKIIKVRGTIMCTGYRRIYQDMKREYLHV